MLSNFNAFVLHLHRAIRTRGGSDTILLFIFYYARLSGATLGILGRASLDHSSPKAVEWVLRLPLSRAAGSLSTTLRRLSLFLSRRIQPITAMLGKWRTMNRLWGVVGTYLAARDLVKGMRSEKGQRENSGGSKMLLVERFKMLLEAARLLLLFGFHLGEASRLLTTKGVTKLSEKTGSRLGMYGIRCWGSSIFLRLFRLVVEWASRSPDSDPAAEEEWKTKWRDDMSVLLSWASLSVHWSGQGGCLPEIAVAAIATCPATVMMKRLWRQTA
ncbi:hypothetical protein ACHAPT_012881 [Fusarium lateritium]